MAASIAGVIWQAVRLIRECRRGAVSSGSLEGKFLPHYPFFIALACTRQPLARIYRA